MLRIVFAGTGGGRFTMGLQKRSTAGMLILTDNPERRILIDPGPGSLVQLLKLHQSPQKVDVLCVSHQHTDHYIDAPVILEEMAQITAKKRGVLIASERLIKGDSSDTPGIPKYYQGLVADVHAVRPGSIVELPGLTVYATPVHHAAEASACGFLFKELSLSYIGDTSADAEIIKSHKSSKYMVINLISNDREHVENIMTVHDAVELLNETKPKRAFLTHFGIRALAEGPERLAKEIEKETGVPTLAAKDGMIVELDGKQRELGD